MNAIPGRAISDVQRWVQHPVHRFLAATLDGFVNDLDAVFEAKFMLPWSFSEEAAAEKHMAQLQHNMWVTNARSAALSIIIGGRFRLPQYHLCRCPLSGRRKRTPTPPPFSEMNSTPAASKA